MNHNLYDFLFRCVSDTSRPCVEMQDGSVVCYSELLDQANRLAGHLTNLCVKVGDRIVVQAPKSIEMVALYLATLQIGAIFVPLNNAYTASEIDYFLADADCKLFIDNPTEFSQQASLLEPLRECEPRAPDDIAAIVYTSGTTGRSKGAMLSHGNLAANARALCDAWAFTEQDVLLHALPVTHLV